MSLEQWYLEIPVVTRVYLTASVLTTAACYFDVISPFTLYLNYRLIFEKYEFWRVFTNFFFLPGSAATLASARRFSIQ